MGNATLIKIVQSKKAVIFDLFHTLTALETTWGGGLPFTYQMLGVQREAWDEQLHYHSRDRLTGMQRDPFIIISEMAHALNPAIPDRTIQEAVQNRIVRFREALINIPSENVHVIQTLKSTGKRIGLISNADVMEVAAWNQSPIAHLFNSVIFSCSVGCVKPEPEIYDFCLQELGVVAEEAMFIGDGGSDELRGAQSMGITTIMVTCIIREIWPNKIAERKRHADYVIEKLFELIT